MRAARIVAAAALVVVAVVAIVTAREWSVGATEAAAADAAASRSDWPAAVAHARAAAEALAPGSPWPERGWTRLEAIAHDAEARGDEDTALLAHGAMRAAALATRALGVGATRDAAHRAEAETGLARVAAARREPPGRPQSGREWDSPAHATAESMLDALRENEPPSPWVLSLVGLAAVLGGAAIVTRAR